MADVLTTNFTHTYAGRELITEIFFQPEEDNWTVENFYRIMQTVDKTNVYLPQSLRKILRKYTTCGFSATGGVTTIDDKVISTEKIKANLEQCVDEFTDTIFAEAMKTGVDVDELSGTVIDSIIREQFVKGLTSDIHRLVWFADSADADADWDQFDGWIRRFVASSADIGADCFVDMDGTAFETGDALAVDGALGLFRQLDSAASAVLDNMADARWYVTRSVAKNYAASLEDQGNEVGQLNLESGITNMQFRGRNVVVVPEWDVNLADATNPWATSSGNTIEIGSNLIVLTSPQNLVVGTDVTSPSNEFKIRYNDDDDEKMKVISKMKLGAQFVHPELVCLAY